MMYGGRERFEYFECLSCGCVQIAKYPDDIARHYPKNYYCGIAEATSKDTTWLESLKQEAKALLLRLPTFRRHWLSRASTRKWLAGKPLLSIYLGLLDDSEARILDVGCGEGLCVQHLRLIGYRNAVGADPFVDHDLFFKGRLLVRRTHFADMTGRFDCISFHHSFEHMPDQAEVLRTGRALLAPGGVMIIRIPVAGGEAWRTYRENWAQLDPPRHFYLHTRASFTALAEQCGLRVQSIVDDSDGFQFWASELYRRDIPLLDPRSPRHDSHAVFSPAELSEYARRAAELNAIGDGDQIIAVLKAPPV